MKEGYKEAAIIGGIGIVLFLLFRRGGTPMQQQSGQVPTAAAPQQFGPYYVAYNAPKGIMPTNSAPTQSAGVANGNLPTCQGCASDIMFGTDTDFARYLSGQLSGIFDTYASNILAMTPDYLKQYFVR